MYASEKDGPATYKMRDQTPPTTAQSLSTTPQLGETTTALTMKTSSPKSYGQYRPLHQEHGIAFRQQEASPKPTVHLLQQTACGTFRPPAHSSTQCASNLPKAPGAPADCQQA